MVFYRQVDKTKHPEKNTLILFLSVLLMSCRHTSQEGSVFNDATPTVNPYSARCVQNKFGYSSSLHPSCYGRRSALFSMAGVAGTRNIALLQRFASRTCTEMLLCTDNDCNGFPSTDSIACDHTHIELKPEALRRLQLEMKTQHCLISNRRQTIQTLAQTTREYCTSLIE